jgi:3-oxoadipate enol-lactonase
VSATPDERSGGKARRPAPRPNIPRGRRIELYRRGTTFVRTVKGPPGAPTVVLLHGLAATAALNWHQVFAPLSEHFRVIAPDLRGHGRGIRSGRRFRLADCAADVAETLRALDADPAIAVGYSMGGPVAQLLWRDHSEVVSGLVLCATGAEFVPGNRERYAMVALTEILASTTRLGSVLGWLPGNVVRRVLNVPTGEQGSPMAAWARKEMSKHSPRLLLEAGHSIATYSARDWLARVDVPTSVLVTTHDSAVAPVAQFRMAKAIPNAHINLVDQGHLACVYPEFGRKVTDACLDVQRRVEQRAAGLWPAPS